MARMDIKFQCDDCGQKIETDASVSGTYVGCPTCGSQVLVPIPRLESGTVIGGCRIERTLGCGAMGEVYLAVQLSMNRKVALKVLPPELTSDEEYVKRFTNEVRTLGRLNHPNIVTAFEAGEDIGYHYLVMLYVEGESLEDRLLEDSTIPESEALVIAANVANALSYAWDGFQILHRDIKPSNIMIDTDGQVRLMDMGISKQVTEDTGLTMAGEIIGTPEYMSPEQAKGRTDLDCRADIYSLGATLYHLVTGQQPFKGDSTMNVLSQLLTEPYSPVCETNPNVSQGCEQLIDRMMAKDSRLRYQSWNEVISDTKRVLSGRPLKRHGASSAHAAPEPAPKRSKAPLFAVAAALIAIAGVAVVVLNRQSRVPPQRLPPPKKRPATSRRAKPVKSRTPAQAWQEQIKAVEEMFETAREYAAQHPDDYDGAIRKFQHVMQDGAKTKFKLKAEDEIRKLQQRRKKAIADVLRNLAAQSEKLAAAERLEDAIRLLTDYSGPFSKETGPARKTKAAALAARQEQAAKNKASLAKAGAARKDEFANKLAGLILKQDFAAASDCLAAARKDKALSAVLDLNALTAELRDTMNVSQIIRDSFTADIGKQIAVQLKNRKETLHVSGVGQDGTIKGTRQIRMGKSVAKIDKSFNVADLSVSEQFKRLGSKRNAATEMMRGLLLYQVHRREAALKSFQESGSMLARAIVAYLTTVVASAEEEKDAAEEAAGEAFRDILRTGGLPIAEEADDRLIASIRGRPYTDEVVTEIRSQVGSFRKEFGKSKVAADRARVLATLVSITPFSNRRLTSALEGLVRSNPPLKNGFRHSEKLSEGSLTVMLENNPGLTDISQLQGLPITVLALNNTKVRNIGPLKGMPLDDLGLWNTKVDDIRPLTGMPLTVLSLNSTSIDSIRALSGMKLTWLDISFTAVRSISVLADMPLQTVKLEECNNLRDISPLKKCVTLTAIILPPKPTSIAFLKKMPNLRFIGTNWREAEMTADAFWAKYGRRFR